MPSSKIKIPAEMLLDPYLTQMITDLKAAEAKLRSDIDYRGMSFSSARLTDSQANVDRLHGLIRSYIGVDDYER